ncbi:hypothetical protein [Georgenia sp. Marseille-Q6866]
MSTDDVVDRDQPRLAEADRDSPLSPELETLRFAGTGGDGLGVPVLETWQEVPVPGSEHLDLAAPYDGSD